jgi:hypothetical protein
MLRTRATTHLRSRQRGGCRTSRRRRKCRPGCRGRDCRCCWRHRSAGRVGGANSVGGCCRCRRLMLQTWQARADWLAHSVACGRCSRKLVLCARTHCHIVTDAQIASRHCCEPAPDRTVRWARKIERIDHVDSVTCFRDLDFVAISKCKVDDHRKVSRISAAQQLAVEMSPNCSVCPRVAKIERATPAANKRETQ